MSLRTAFPAGPAYLSRGGLTIEMAADWKAESEIVSVDVETNLHGVVGKSEDYVITKITGKPIATSSNIAALFAEMHPYTPEMLGQLIMPAVDVPLVIQTRDGKSVTYAASALTKEPEITFGPNVDILGEFEYTCLRALGADPTAAGDVVESDDSAFVAPLMDPLTRIRSPYTVAWGASAPFDAIETKKDGVKLSKTTTLSAVEPMLTSLINWRIEKVEASISFDALNLDVGDFYAFVQLAAATAGVGRMLGARGQQLTVASTKSGDPQLFVPLAVPDKGPLQFGKESRVGNVNLMAHRKSSAGVLQPLYTLGVVA